MSYGVVLRRLATDRPGKGLRTEAVVGWCDKLPEVGQPFVMTAPPLVEGVVRCIDTSPVRTVDRAGKTTSFTTDNSQYLLIERGT